MTMFPSAQTNRYGDLLRELYTGIKDGNLSEPRMEEIRRVFNELHEREAIYRSWVGADKKANLELPRIRYPRWLSSPLHALYMARSATQSIPDNTTTPVSFSGFSADSDYFQMMEATKIRILSGSVGENIGRLIGIMGTVQWDTNGAGRRGFHVEVYNSADAQIFGLTLHSLLPTSVDVDTMPYVGLIYFSTLGDADYLKFTVVQTSGGALNVRNIRLGVFLLI